MLAFADEVGSFCFIERFVKVFSQLVQPEAKMMPPCGLSVATLDNLWISTHMEITSSVAPWRGGGVITFHVRFRNCIVYSSILTVVLKVTRIVPGRTNIKKIRRIRGIPYTLSRSCGRQSPERRFMWLDG